MCMGCSHRFNVNVYGLMMTDPVAISDLWAEDRTHALAPILVTEKAEPVEPPEVIWKIVDNGSYTYSRPLTEDEMKNVVR
jgi:hypothetical protein